MGTKGRETQDKQTQVWQIPNHNNNNNMYYYYCINVIVAAVVLLDLCVVTSIYY